MSIKITTEIFIEKAKKVHGDKYTYDKVKYEKARKKVVIHCNTCEKDFEQSPMSHLHGSGCPYCADNTQLTLTEFIQRAKKVHGDKYDYSKVKYKNAREKVIIHCNTCNLDFKQTPHCHLSKRGCPRCGRKTAGNKLRLSFAAFMQRACKIHGNRYAYQECDEFTTTSFVTIICKKCYHKFKQSANNHLAGAGCPYCRQSKGELKVQQWLTLRNINFLFQYKFKDCKDKKALPFDFYLPKYNTCIEFQGQQHYDENYYKWKNDLTRNFKTQQKHDQIKKDYCRTHNIQLLEIRYDEKIEDKLENFFKKYKK